MAKITQVISSFPEPLPNRNTDSPQAFSLHVDAFLAHINTHVDEENTWGSQANDLRDEVNNLRDETEYLKNQTENTAKNIATGANFFGTSNTSVTIGTGLVTLTINESDRAFGAGSYVRATRNGGTEYIEGIVQSYSGNDLTINVLATNGMGTFNSWWVTFVAGNVAEMPPQFDLMQAMSFYS